MDAPEIEKLKALALAYVYEDGDHWYSVGQLADGITYEPAVNFITDCSAATVLTLIAEVERLRADAERYQWIRDVENSDDAWNMIGSGLDDTKLDTAIDAAIEKEKA